jgi:hypothetical protein
MTQLYKHSNVISNIPMHIMQDGYLFLYCGMRIFANMLYEFWRNFAMQETSFFCFSLLKEEVWQELYHFSGSVVRLVRGKHCKTSLQEMKLEGIMGHAMIIFWKIKSVVSVHDHWFQFFSCLFKNKYKYTDFDYCYEKHLLRISKDITEFASEILLSFPSLSLVDFLQSPPLIGCRNVFLN